MTLSRLLCLCGLLASALSAQAPSFTNFGNPCSGAVLPLNAVNLPRIGQTFRLQVLSSGGMGYEGGTPSALVAGLSRTSWLGRPLPWTPATIQMLGGFACGDLSVSAESTLLLPWQTQRILITVSLPIPNNPALVGTSVFFQTADYRSNLTHMTLSITLGTAGEARIGL
jgi:hypothetical protein